MNRRTRKIVRKGRKRFILSALYSALLSLTLSLSLSLSLSHSLSLLRAEKEETEVHANERVNEAAARSLVRNQCRTLDLLFRELQCFCDITERRYM